MWGREGEVYCVGRECDSEEEEGYEERKKGGRVRRSGVEGKRPGMSSTLLQLPW